MRKGGDSRTDVRGSFGRTSPVRTSVRPLNTWKSEHLGAGIHHPSVRRSMTPGGGFKTIRSEQLRADFCPLVRTTKKGKYIKDTWQELVGRRRRSSGCRHGSALRDATLLTQKYDTRKEFLNYFLCKILRISHLIKLR